MPKQHGQIYAGGQTIRRRVPPEGPIQSTCYGGINLAFTSKRKDTTYFRVYAYDLGVFASDTEVILAITTRIITTRITVLSGRSQI